jgi:hypothetical protein
MGERHKVLRSPDGHPLAVHEICGIPATQLLKEIHMLTAIEIARVCHEVNRAYCKSLGDESQLPWEDAPDWQKKSAIKGVQFIIDNDNAAPSASHDSWLREKTADGWVYGPVKDVDLKQHPCCVPYEQLPPEQKAKDYIFGSIVRSIRATVAERLGDGVAGDRSPV